MTPHMARLRLIAVALVCVAALPAASALAARKSSALPAITSVGPLKAEIGSTLTIRGRNFLPGARRNTVAFKRAGARVVSVRAGQATRTQIKVVVPASLAKLLSVKGGVAQPTRFRVRVRARRVAKSFTALKRSVLIVPRGALGSVGGSPGDCGGAADPLDGLTDALDDTLGTDLGDTLDTLLPDATCSGDDPSAGDGATDPAADEPDDGAGDPSDPFDAGAAGDDPLG